MDLSKVPPNVLFELRSQSRQGHCKTTLDYAAKFNVRAFGRYKKKNPCIMYVINVFLVVVFDYKCGWMKK